MARLRHFAVCVKDLEKAATFYETVFELKRAGREDLEIGSAIYLTDGVINLALLNFSIGPGAKAADTADPRGLVGAHHFGFQVDDLEAAVSQYDLELLRLRAQQQARLEERARIEQEFGSE